MCEISRRYTPYFNNESMTWKWKKNVTIEDDWGEPAKGPPMVKSDFSLGVKYSEWVNRNAYLWFDKVGSFFIESLEWVYLLGAINIVGDVWT